MVGYFAPPPPLLVIAGASRDIYRAALKLIWQPTSAEITFMEKKVPKMWTGCGLKRDLRDTQLLLQQNIHYPEIFWQTAAIWEVL